MILAITLIYQRKAEDFGRDVDVAALGAKVLSSNRSRVHMREQMKLQGTSISGECGT